MSTRLLIDSYKGRLMQKLLHGVVAILLSMLLIPACQPDDDVIAIDERLMPYFAAFEAEAEKRGLVFDLEDLKVGGMLTDLSDSEVSGQCVQPNDGQHFIRIDEVYWAGLPDDRREFIVFHELGHCVLDRRHLDHSLADGTCLSMMNSGKGTCENNYNATTRNYYLDELFEVQ